MNKSNISKIKKRLLIIGVVTILILGVQWVVQYLQVDACLDKGGCWDYNLKKCNCSHTFDSTRIADYYWKSEYDTTLNREYLKRGVLLDSISKSTNELIDFLNRRPSKSKVEIVEIIDDTLVIRILDDTFLTEQMGSLGAYCYMAETVFTLTENDSTQFVKFEMDYGSHANPGVYSREDYKDVILK